MNRIAWPRGPFALEPPPPPGAGPWVVMLCGLVLLAMAIGLIAVVSRLPQPRQDWLDLAASFGAGRPIADASIGKLECSPWRRRASSPQIEFHRCYIHVTGAGLTGPIELRSHRPITSREVEGVVRIGNAVALAWPRRFALRRIIWTGVLTLACLALAAIGAMFLRLALAGGRQQRLARRLARRGQIVEVDLLRRRLLPRRGAVWDFAYDLDGKRIYARKVVTSDPLILDGTVTRGAALVMPGGRALLLLHGFAPLRFAPAEAVRLTRAVTAQFNADRPLATMLPSDGPRGWAQRFVAAQVEAWNACDVPQVDAAIERRHAAAWQGGTRQLDAVLLRLRGALPTAHARQS